ncbi:MAG: formylglycine-generating enzyme family protein [Alphaproteobacteria bacterium]|nr:formylglycine-generating enzyme family protein [Alphaproteobacteria bacterium]MCB9696080.1 formylglycine-generating enzyme family protein [Alphaproteobacteria bacterium]
MWSLLLACHPPSTDEEVPVVDTSTDSSCVQAETVCEDEVCWVRMCGGAFEMGAWHDLGIADEQPVHTVHLTSFDILQTEVLVATWDRCVTDGACVDVIARGAPSYCQDRLPEHPRGCLSAEDAADVCAWLGGSVASEAQWEYAARSGGQERIYPWGDEPAPTCDLAVLGYVDNDPCGEEGPGLACSRPDGNTADGLCDMAGNLYEWVADAYHGSYDGAPADGSAWTEPPSTWGILRGGGINSDESVTTTNRVFHEPTFYYSGSGTRCVRPPPPEARR